MKVSSDGRLAIWPEPEARRNFEHRLNAGLRREWDSLSQESDPEILADAALHIASRLESSDQSEKAAYLLSGLSGSSKIPARLQEKAEGRLAALHGGGNFGHRVESMLGHLLREARRPWPMLALAGAGTCFQISRLALLARWRGPAANLALPLATVGEAAAFTLSIPVLEKLAPPPGGTAWRGFGSEFLSSLLLMGSLKLSTWPLRFASSSLHFPALYGGVLLAQATERRLGLRPEAAGGTAMIDGLALALQIQAGAGIARLALGSGGLRFLAEAQMRSQPRPTVILSAFDPSGLRMTSGNPTLPRPYMMMGSDDSGSGPSSRPLLRLVSLDPYQEFVKTYAMNQPFQDAYHRILNHYGQRHDSSKFSSLLFNSGVQHPGIMNPGLNKLAEILCTNSGETALSYRNWLTQRVYERVYFESRSPLALGEILRSLAGDEGIAPLERRLAEHFPELDLRAPRPLNTPENSIQFKMKATQRLYEWREFERASKTLPLDDRARMVVFDWKRAQAEHYLGNMQSPIDRFLDDFYELGQGPHALKVSQVNTAIASAGESPLGAARLARLQTLLEARRLDPPLDRLQELFY